MTTLKHGHSRRGKQSKTYWIWSAMIQRCTNENSKDYVNYGSKGIEVCNRWREFNNFLQDMGEKPDGLTLERINVLGNYEPSNCKWENRSVQSANRGKFSSNTVGYTGVFLHDDKLKHYKTVVKFKGKVVFRLSGKDPHHLAKERDKFIIENNLPHKLNFS